MLFSFPPTQTRKKMYIAVKNVVVMSCDGNVEALPPQLEDYSRYVSTCFYYMFYATISFWLGKCC